MNILFIGLGSIGSRHLRNITKLLKEKHIDFKIEALRSTNRELSPDLASLIDRQIYDFSQISNYYDIVFITNPTHLHFHALKQVQKLTKKIFLEKPVFDSLEVNLQDIVFQNNTICYVAAPLRFTNVYSWIKNNIRDKKVYSARSICSSYLPEWRPAINYRNCYSAKKSQGGDIGLELIHEMDYITDLFGIPETIKMIAGHYSHLEITSDDIALYIAEYQDKLISIHLDYFGRIPKREIEIYCQDEVIVGDFINRQIILKRSGEIISLPEDRDNYQQKELEYFLTLDKNTENINTLNHAFDVLKLAKGVSI